MRWTSFGNMAWLGFKCTRLERRCVNTSKGHQRFLVFEPPNITNFGHKSRPGNGSGSFHPHHNLVFGEHCSQPLHFKLGALLGLPTVSLLCTPYALWEKKNRRIFVYIKCSVIQTTFLARKYGLQAADFRDDAVWGVIWLADKWATGPWDVTHMGFRCIASQFTIKYDVP